MSVDIERVAKLVGFVDRLIQIREIDNKIMKNIKKFTAIHKTSIKIVVRLRRTAAAPASGPAPSQVL